MTAPAPDAIARSLTPAMRRALLWLPADGMERAWPDNGNRETFRSLRQNGFSDAQIDRVIGMMLRWATPLGLAVRAIVAREDGHGD